MTAVFARLRGRASTILFSAAVVLALIAGVLLTTAAAAPAVALAQSGHWVFNRVENAAFHVDGGTRQVDARVAVPDAAAEPLFVLQNERQGFLVGRESVTAFGKSTLTVDAAVSTGQSEVPVGIEVVGGPYLVYRQAGTIVRLGVPSTSIQVGGAVGDPVRTADGTVWMHRLDNGSLCALRRDAAALDCDLGVAPGIAGALTVASGLPTFVNTAPDDAQVVDEAALRSAVPTGVDLPPQMRLADQDTRGRLPAVVPVANRLVLADSSGIPLDRAGGSPITIELGAGEFSSPAAADGVVAVIEQVSNTLLTFGLDGSPLGRTPLPPGAAPASLTRGEDGRIWVDDADGANTHVIGGDGAATAIPTGGQGATTVEAAPASQAAPAPPPRPVTDFTPGIGPARPRGPVVNQPGRVDQPAVGPVSPNLPPPPIQPVAPLPPARPPAPADVRAVVGPNGGVTVSWSPVDGGGAPWKYAVRANGANLNETNDTSVSYFDLAAGGTYTFVVTAATSVGTSPPSAPSNTVQLPPSAPGAPTGLVVAGQFQGARTFFVDVSWQRPALNGGELMHYIIVVTDSAGNVLLNTTSNGTSSPRATGDRCLRPFQVSVRAVTRNRGGAESVQGPPAMGSSGPGSCPIDMVITAGTVANTTASINLAQSNEIDPFVSAPCSLRLNGTTRWTGRCGGAATPSDPVLVDGLQPATAYEVVLLTEQVAGGTASSNTLSFTTGDTCSQPDPLPPGC